MVISPVLMSETFWTSRNTRETNTPTLEIYVDRFNCNQLILKWVPRRKWVPRESHMSPTRNRALYWCKKDLDRQNIIKYTKLPKKNYINTLYVSINRSFRETRPAGKNDNSGCTSGFIVESLFIIYLFIYLFTNALIC